MNGSASASFPNPFRRDCNELVSSNETVQILDSLWKSKHWGIMRTQAKCGLTLTVYTFLAQSSGLVVHLHYKHIACSPIAFPCRPFRPAFLNSSQIRFEERMNTCDLNAVVISSDPVVVGSLSSCLEKFGISAAVYRETSAAMQTLRNQKTDAFLVDRECDPEFSVLKAMRHSTSSRSAVAFAIISEMSSANGAFSAADFVMDKPLASRRVSRTMQAAYGIMLKERMRYSRHSLRTLATLVDASSRQFQAETTNVSQTGIALECIVPVTPGEVLQIEFALPGDAQKLNCKAQVIWAADNKTGLTFKEMKERARERLNEWIESQFLLGLHHIGPLTSDRSHAPA